jgi:hypothetical protein
MPVQEATDTASRTQGSSPAAIIVAMGETGVRRLVCVSNSGMYPDG